jgi:hypothetical protein
MSDASRGLISRPSHCQVSVSPDRKHLALTFRADGQSPVSIVLPVLGVAALQAKLARSLFLLGVRVKQRVGAQAGSQDAAGPDVKEAA